MKLYLETFANCVQTREPDTDDDWDRGDTQTYWSFENVYTDREGLDSYDSIEVDDSYKTGDTIYLVVVVYNTGDSFGHDENYGAEIVSAHRTFEKAQFAKDVCQNSVGKGFSPLNLGDDYKLTYFPWNGFF